jgi:hypothetical protein
MTIYLYYLVIFSCNQGVSSSWTLSVDGNGEGFGAKLKIKLYILICHLSLIYLWNNFNNKLDFEVQCLLWFHSSLLIKVFTYILLVFYDIIFHTYLLRTIDDDRLIEIIEFWILLKSSLNDESVSSLLSAVVDVAVIVCADLLSEKK